MTRASRTIPRGPFSPTRSVRLPGLMIAVLLSGAFPALAQDEQPAPNDIVVPPHWSRYTAPTTYPEGTQLHIIQRDDTLWDLSNQYLRNPFLWPQLWDANRYIENPHLIYPGDPVRIPDVDVVRPEGVEPGTEGIPGQPGAPGTGPGGEPGVEGGPGAAGGPSGPGGEGGPRFHPAYEETSIQCAGYLREEGDDDFRIFESEEGTQKVALASGDVVYLNRGMEDGINPGETYYTQRRVPFTWGVDGSYVRRTGWVRVIAVQEETAMAEIVQACSDVKIDDYLKPFEPVPVPLLPVQAHATRLTPESGRMRGKIVASLDDLASLGRGYLVSIDVGQEDGVVPGNIFTVFRYVHDDAPRKMLGEIAVLTVQNEHATGRIMHSYDFMVVGDLVELK